MKFAVKSVVFICLMAIATTVHSQKGMGESEGMAEKGKIPELVPIKGVVEKIKKGPCTFAVGKSISGTHLIISTPEESVLNIHLGPTTRVYEFVANSKGGEIAIVAFRTKKLPKGHYIAKELVYNGDKLVLRDGYLKPFWARGNGREFW